jgi:hypothetical protein
MRSLVLLVSLLAACAHATPLQTQERVAVYEADALTALESALHDQMHGEYARMRTTAQLPGDLAAVELAMARRWAPVQVAYAALATAHADYVAALRYAETFTASKDSPSLASGLSAGATLARRVLASWADLLTEARIAGLDVPAPPQWLVDAGGAS